MKVGRFIDVSAWVRVSNDENTGDTVYDKEGFDSISKKRPLYV